MNRLLRMAACLVACLMAQGALAQEASRGIPATDEGLAGAGPIRRVEWFQKTWNNRREAFAKSAANDHDAVVLLGDSITQGWGGRLKSAFPGMKVANRGISGDTTRGMLYRLKEDVLDLNPRAVVMLMGTNDLEEGAAADDIVGNIRLILGALKAHRASLPIIVCTVFPSSETKKRPADRIREINAKLAEAVKGDAQITLVDTWAMFADPQGNAPAAEFPDLLHLNDAGYAKWGAALRPVLETLGLLTVEPDQFQPEEGFELLFNGRDLSGWACARRRMIN